MSGPPESVLMGTVSLDVNQEQCEDGPLIAAALPTAHTLLLNVANPAKLKLTVVVNFIASLQQS